MKCPQCQTKLKTVLSRRAVLIDVCPSCSGKWLDQGELNYFLGNKGQLLKYEQNGLLDIKASEKNCPKCEVNLTKGLLAKESFPTEECPKCKGLWFDQAEFIKISKTPDNGLAKMRAKFLSLPPLGLTSLLVFSSMYAILFGVIVFMITLHLLNDKIGILIAVGFVFLQYFFGPLIMDFSLRLIGSLRWIKCEELPPHLQDFIKKTCAKNKISLPKIGLIEDGSPQAYTYGCTPSDARLVLSQGLLDILEPEEREAVVAHEIGHIVHWDFLLMTLAQLVPLILYHLYRTCHELSKRKSGSKKGGQSIIAAAVVAYIAYLITQYLMLFLSRVREYWADRFSVETTKNPNALIGALSKIAFGLIAYDNENKEKKKTAIQALGVMNISSSKEMALYSSQPLTSGTKDLKEIMRWDLWSPWAALYEFSSTHPLTAKRINAISASGLRMGIEPPLLFDLQKTESYWDDFFIDVLIYLAPFIGGLLVAILTYPQMGKPSYILNIAMGVSLGGFIKTFFCYPRGSFPKYSIVSLLRKMKVSPVTAIPVTLKGTIIGKGDAGNIFSEDLVLRDSTGLIFLDYEQPLAIMNFFFALTKAKHFCGQEVKIEGWYRRAPIPYIELFKIESSTEESTCYVFYYKLLFWTLLPFLVWLSITFIRNNHV